MIHTLNLKYNIEEAKEYLSILGRDYMHLHWNYRKDHNDPGSIDPKNFMDDVHGWGLQTIYDDPDFPYHCDIDPHNEEHMFFKDTPMVFGFFERLKSKFENPYRAFLMHFPSHHYIGKWLPTIPLHGKIFLPISTNKECFFVSYADKSNPVLFEEGNIYLFDMTEHYGEFHNNGDTEISFITFNVPKETFPNILNLKVIV